MSTVIGRFAPSPSGRMHLGNVFSALIAWSAAKSEGGKIVLRIEDLDPRAQNPHTASLLMEDLQWLGLTWDAGPFFQSDRKELYLDALTKLKSKDLLYPCFCSRADLHAATAPHTSDQMELVATFRKKSEKNVFFIKQPQHVLKFHLQTIPRLLLPSPTWYMEPTEKILPVRAVIFLFSAATT